MEDTIVVIGAGPAGMMAAISAAVSGKKVTLIEKNPSFGKKLLLTGSGRCNLTHACDTEGFIARFSGTGKFLRDAFKAFGKDELLSFFRERGLHTKVEEDGRIFPVTDKASSVLDVLIKELELLKVKTLFNTEVKGIILDGDAVSGVLCSGGRKIAAGKIILTTGGVSYEETGSTGEGIEMARNIGHDIITLRQGLVPLDLKSEYPAYLEGVSLYEVKLIFRSGGKKYATKKNSLIFTGKGISGPVVLSHSRKAVDWISEGKKVSVEIDIMPDAGPEGLDGILVKSFSDSPAKSVKNILRSMMPSKLADVILKTASVDPDKRANQITSPERGRLRDSLKALRFDVAEKVPFERARVTRGGISIKDIDPATMGSRRVKGLYFAGEIIDVDGDCGGFNLQAAFSTGYLAGMSAAEGK